MRKYMPYIAAAAAFVIAWAVYFNVLFYNLDNILLQMLERNAALTTQQVAEALEWKAYTLQERLEGHTEGDREIAAASLSLEEGVDYALLSFDGELLSPETGDVLSVKEQSAPGGGYRLFYLEDWAGKGPRVALSLAPDRFDFRLAQLLSLEEYAALLEECLPLPVFQTMLFDDEAQPVLAAGPSQESLIQDAALFGQNQQQISYTGGRLRYSLFLPLPQPGGWFMGVQVSGTQLYPQLTNLINATFLICAVSALVLMGLLLVGLLRQKRNRRAAGTMDPLTGLLTSGELEGQAKAFFQRNAMKDYSLVGLDVVAFRRINAMHNADVGDLLLRAVGECLGREYHCATRLSADTFLFVAKSSIRLADEVESTLNTYMKRIMGRQYLPGVVFKFGIYPLLEESLEFREAYDGALLALRRAKSLTDRNDITYDRKMQRTAKMQQDIEINMVQALADREFVMYVQPKFLAEDTSCCGGEVLVRWQSELMGFLTPVHFVPLFEKNGFIVDVDFYMMEQLLIRMQALVDAGKTPFPLSINQSRITIAYPGYLDRLSALVSRFTVPLRHIQIEITESAMSDNRAGVIALVGELHKMGFSVAMDDFGTGYSSLGTLRELAVDVLKLDKAFLRESDSSERGRTIIESVLNMARELDMTTVCEGVETGIQLDFLQKAGCHEIQGYLMAKPVPYHQYEKQFIG